MSDGQPEFQQQTSSKPSSSMVGVFQSRDRTRGGFGTNGCGGDGDDDCFTDTSAKEGESVCLFGGGGLVVAGRTPPATVDSTVRTEFPIESASIEPTSSSCSSRSKFVAVAVIFSSSKSA